MRVKEIHARRRAGGFSLVELLVAVVIVAVLTTIAVPSYRSYMLESRRAAAQAALADAASRQEQFFLSNKSYTATIGTGGLNTSATLDGGHYLVSVDTPVVSCAIANCFVLRAVPQNGQVADRCGELTYDVEGTRLPASCW